MFVKLEDLFWPTQTLKVDYCGGGGEEGKGWIAFPT